MKYRRSPCRRPRRAELRASALRRDTFAPRDMEALLRVVSIVRGLVVEEGVDESRWFNGLPLSREQRSDQQVPVDSKYYDFRDFIGMNGLFHSIFKRHDCV